MIYMTSDTHFFHSAMVERKWRNFSSICEMNSKIIENWNSVVRDDDAVYFLGDFYLDGQKKTKEKYLSLREKLNGKIHFILGNHDYKDAIVEANCFESVDYYKELKISRKKLCVLMHYPILSWHKQNIGSFMLHGHSHSSLKDASYLNRKTLDIGMDTNNFMPYSLEEVLDIMDKKTIIEIDHHKEREF